MSTSVCSVRTCVCSTCVMCVGLSVLSARLPVVCSWLFLYFCLFFSLFCLYLCQYYLSVLLSVDISFNLLSQPESGVATPPKKPWTPIGGDRRVSVSVTASSQSGFTLPHYGRGLRRLHGYWLACLLLIINPQWTTRTSRGPSVNSRVLNTLPGVGRGWWDPLSLREFQVPRGDSKMP